MSLKWQAATVPLTAPGEVIEKTITRYGKRVPRSVFKSSPSKPDRTIVHSSLIPPCKPMGPPVPVQPKCTLRLAPPSGVPLRRSQGDSTEQSGKVHGSSKALYA